MSRRTFSPEFKVEAARKVLAEGMRISQARQTFGVGDTAMRRWVKQLAAERADALPPWAGKPLTAEQLRIRELEAQVRQLQEEKAIRKKSMAFFVQEPTGPRWCYE